MIRLSAMTWPFPFLVRLGWATGGIPNPDPLTARGTAFLLRGNGMIFSRGMGVLCRQLRRARVWAEDLRCVGDRWVCRKLIRDFQSNLLRGPIILVGHSCGGRYALYAAHKLHRAGIRVALLICLDVAWPPEVAPNVTRAVNLYLTGKRLYPARPLRPALGASAVIENIDVRSPDSPVPGTALNHLNITDHPAIQAFVIARIEDTLAAAGSWEPKSFGPFLR